MKRAHSILTAALVAMLTAPAVQAAGDEWRLTINGLSRHFSTDTPRDELNERNPGIGLERHMESWYAAAGSYVDSYDCEAGYIGGGQRWRMAEGHGLSLDLGYLVSAHFRCLDADDPGQKLVPAVVPTVTLGALDGLVQINALITPPVKDIIEDPGVGFSLSIRLP
ncbi:MAG TPA: hypothetical protein VK979_05315 [Guyparkeria sp.]|nr:hypothetical protein [Guyparkeria sp.]